MRAWGAKIAGVVASALLLSQAACVSQTGFGRATTLAPGKNRFGGGVEASLLTPKLTPQSAAPLPWLQLSAGYHRGVSEHVEIGGRISASDLPDQLSTFGLAADLKVQILRREPGGSSPDIAAGLAAGYHLALIPGAPYHTFGGSLPLLVGIHAGRHQIVLGPRIADYVLASYGQNPLNAFWFGGSVGASLHVREVVELFPELVVLYSPVSFNGETSGDNRVGVATIQLGFGVYYDQPSDPPQ